MECRDPGAHYVGAVTRTKKLLAPVQDVVIMFISKGSQQAKLVQCTSCQCYEHRHDANQGSSGSSDSQDESTAGSSTCAAEISRVAARSVDSYVRCSRTGNQFSRYCDLQLLIANDRGG